MKERTKKLMTGYDVYKAYDEQQKIRKNYFKGCEYCEGDCLPLFQFGSYWTYDYALQIKGNSLNLFGREKGDKLPKLDLKEPRSYNQLNGRDYLGHRDINFCPFCGKQLVDKLK